MTEELCSDLDRYIDHARSMNLTPHQMLDLQTQIAGVRYTLSHKMAEAERAMLSAKDRRDRPGAGSGERYRGYGVDPPRCDLHQDRPRIHQGTFGYIQ